MDYSIIFQCVIFVFIPNRKWLNSSFFLGFFMFWFTCDDNSSSVHLLIPIQELKIMFSLATA